ncbi:peptidyl-prolyl cis-trans isomerase CWC27 [Cryptosporidium felis]|nr:peptidyl-prolyl cis-trans isomerase CWC27 [Cryptosporidium felis]
MQIDLPTTGKLIFETTLGEIDIELWCRECPNATKTLLSLCEKGFFDGKQIKKVIKDHIIILSELGPGTHNKFEQEINKRLRYKYRGLVGLFNADEDTRKIGSQNHIFITMNPIEEFNNKYALIGKVVNSTIFNLINMQNVEVNREFSPEIPIRIIKTIVIMNPFSNHFVPKKIINSSELNTTNPKCESERGQISIINRNLLSFNQEDEQEFGLGSQKGFTNGSEIIRKHIHDSKEIIIEEGSLDKESETNEEVDLDIRFDEVQISRNSEQFNKAIKKPRSKAEKEEIMRRLREFEHRLKRSISSDNGKWYNKKGGLHFGIDSSNAYKSNSRKDYL